MIPASGDVKPRRRPLFWMPFVAAAWITVAYTAVELFGRGFLWALPLPSMDVQQFMAGMHSIESIGLAALVGLYALKRVVGYSPFGNRNYARWLAGTPWTPDDPLPMGPVHLVWEDLIMLVVIAASSQIAGGWVISMIVFSVIYTLLLLKPGAPITDAAVGYVTMFGWATVVLLWDNPWITCGLAVTLLIISQLGLWNALAKFPWHTQALEHKKRNQASRSTKDWGIGPLPPPQPIHPLHAWLSPLLVGWWIFCLVSHFPPVATPDDRNAVVFMGILAVSWMGLFRFLAYCSRHHSPISLWGRLWTGRWIVPGYDYVLIAPLSTCIIGSLLMIGLTAGGADAPETFGIVTAIALACALNLPPTRRSWQLTGHHRIVMIRHPQGKDRRRPVESRSLDLFGLYGS